MPDREALFRDNLAWAEALARSVARKLPPSFDRQDLEQEARIEHWKRCELYDPALNNSYQAYAYQWILNAVRMKTRRRAFAENTHEPLWDIDPADEHPDPEERLIQDQARAVSDRCKHGQRQVVEARMEGLSAAEQYLVKRVHLDGEDSDDLAKLLGMGVGALSRRVAAGVRGLKKK